MKQAHSGAATAPLAPARHRINADRLIAFLLILPTLIAVAIFVYGFIAWTGFISMTAWKGLLPNYTFVGFENYATIFNQGRFQTNLRNTVVFTSFFLAGCLGIGLLLAVMLDACRTRWGEAAFRTIYLFPMALSLIVTGVVWRWIFTPGSIPDDPTGINLLLSTWGLDWLQGKWITDSAVVPGWQIAGLKTKIGVPLAIIPIVVAAVWQMSGFTMAMYLAGLRGISDEIREAARVDGASEWQIFTRIILPLLRPVTLSAVIILGHISLKIFDLVVTMTGGGPGNATEVPGVYMYEVAFKANKFAEGAAAAMVMLIMVAVLILPYLIYNRVEDAA